MPLKVWIPLLGLAAAGVVGVCVPFVATTSQALEACEILASFVGLFFLFWWIQVDRRERRITRSRAFNFGVAWLAIVVVPTYLLRTRGAGRGLLALVGFFALMLAWSLALILGTAGGLISMALLSN
jgi:hypothetical protein